MSGVSSRLLGLRLRSLVGTLHPFKDLRWTAELQPCAGVEHLPRVHRPAERPDLGEVEPGRVEPRQRRLGRADTEHGEQRAELILDLVQHRQRGGRVRPCGRRLRSGSKDDAGLGAVADPTTGEDGAGLGEAVAGFPVRLAEGVDEVVEVLADDGGEGSAGGLGDGVASRSR